MIFLEEQWKAIVIEKNGIVYDYTGLYEVSNLGRVRSLNYMKTGDIQILKLNKNNRGYLVISLSKNGKRKQFFVHRLVATAFITNNNNLTDVNHKNEIKTDNRVENLEWTTHKDNINYGTRTKRIVKIRSKKVMAISLTEKKVIVFQSINQAYRFRFSKSSVGICCREKQKSYKGYYWRYIEEEKELDC